MLSRNCKFVLECELLIVTGGILSLNINCCGVLFYNRIHPNINKILIPYFSCTVTAIKMKCLHSIDKLKTLSAASMSLAYVIS